VCVLSYITLFRRSFLRVERVASSESSMYFLQTVYTICDTMSQSRPRKLFHVCSSTCTGTTWISRLDIVLHSKAAILVWQYLTLYVQFCAPDDGRRNRLKRIEQFIEINRSRNVATFGCTLEIYLRCTDMWTSNILLMICHASFCNLFFFRIRCSSGQKCYWSLFLFLYVSCYHRAQHGGRLVW
jgi:hypothetical protein